MDDYLSFLPQLRPALQILLRSLHGMPATISRGNAVILITAKLIFLCAIEACLIAALIHSIRNRS